MYSVICDSMARLYVYYHLFDKLHLGSSIGTRFVLFVCLWHTKQIEYILYYSFCIFGNNRMVARRSVIPAFIRINYLSINHQQKIKQAKNIDPCRLIYRLNYYCFNASILVNDRSSNIKSYKECLVGNNCTYCGI